MNNSLHEVECAKGLKRCQQGTMVFRGRRGLREFWQDGTKRVTWESVDCIPGALSGSVCWDLWFMSGNGGRYVSTCCIGAVFLRVLGGQEE